MASTFLPCSVSPLLRVSGCACLLGVWHTRSRLSCVKHAARPKAWPSQGRMCAWTGFGLCLADGGLLLQALVLQGGRVEGPGVGPGSIGAQLSSPASQAQGVCDHGQILAIGTNERLCVSGGLGSR